MESLFSRKLWVAIATAVTIALQEKFGLSLDPEALVSLAVVAVAYISGQSVVDKNKVQAEVQAQVLQLNTYVAMLAEKLKSFEATPEA